MALVDQDNINKRIIAEIQKIKLSGISPDFSSLKTLIDSNTANVGLVIDSKVYADIAAVNAAWDSSTTAKTPNAGQLVQVGDATGLQTYIYIAVDPTKPTVLTWESLGSDASGKADIDLLNTTVDDADLTDLEGTTLVPGTSAIQLSTKANIDLGNTAVDDADLTDLEGTKLVSGTSAIELSTKANIDLGNTAVDETNLKDLENSKSIPGTHTTVPTLVFEFEDGANNWVEYDEISHMSSGGSTTTNISFNGTVVKNITTAGDNLRPDLHTRIRRV